jgi:hypothetical protein
MAEQTLPQSKPWIAEFRVESELGLTEGAKKLVYRHPTGKYEASLVDVKDDKHPDENLAVRIILEAADLATAEMETEAVCRGFLYLLSFATNTGFEIKRRTYVLDWSKGTFMRHGRVYAPRFEDDPTPALNDTILRTIAILQTWGVTPILERSLRWFANGIRSRVMEDQYQYFWFVVEGLAVSSKPAGKVTDKCQRCGGELRCDSCHELSTHRPFEKQAIEALFDRLGVLKTLVEHFFAVRNSLLHGETREAIIAARVAKEPKFRFDRLVDYLGEIAWRATIAAFEKIDPPEKLEVFAPNTYVHWHMTASAEIEIGVPNPMDPQPEHISLPHISLVKPEPTKRPGTPPKKAQGEAAPQTNPGAT